MKKQKLTRELAERKVASKVIDKKELKLVKKAARGNVNAYGQLVEIYKKYLYRMAYTYTKEEQSALDIVQDCILKGFESVKNIQEPEYFKTWLTRILIHTAVDHLRKSDRYEKYEDSYTGEAEKGLGLEEKWDLYDAIDALPEKFKTVIILKCFNEMQIQEIAYAMEIPEGTVKSYLHRAKSELKEYLREDYIYVQ